MDLTCVTGSSVNECSPPDNKPLWKYVTKLGKINGGGGNVAFTCNFCNVTYKGSYSRVKAHLLNIVGAGIRNCPKVTFSQISEMRKLEEEVMQRKQSGRLKNIPLPCYFHGNEPSYFSASVSETNSSSFKQENEDKKRKVVGDGAFEKASDLPRREELDEEIARMFYSSGLPFNLARNPHFIRAFSMAANSGIDDYVPPSYNALRTKLLQREKENIENALELTKFTWNTKGVTLVCDGWTDPRPLINFFAVNESGAMFLTAVNSEGEYEDENFISNSINEVIASVGPTNVVQVITDNAPVCKEAGLLIEQKYPHVFWTPCVVYALNLALKNICAAKNTEADEITYEECHWVAEVAYSATMIKNFVLNHSMRLAIFNEFSKLKLLSVAETRFASVVVMLKRFRLMKQQLRMMVISEQWPSYRQEDIEKAKLVKEKLLDDSWWDMIDYILAFTKPIYDMLRSCDTDKPCLHLVYVMWNAMMSQVKAAIYKHEKKQDCEDSTFWSCVQRILEDRWTKSSTPLHGLAHSLNPRCTTAEWQSQYPNLTPPHRDAEISNMRRACLNRFFPNDDERRQVNVEFANFIGCYDKFCNGNSMRSRWEMDPIEWWSVHGASAPHLQTIAIKLLGQVSSSSCCEKNWSTYSFVHSTKRNQITSQRAKDLVFVHNNLRLLSGRVRNIQKVKVKCGTWEEMDLSRWMMKVWVY